MFIEKLMITVQKNNRKIFIVFDDLITDILTNKKVEPILTELFIRCRKLNAFIAFYHIIILGSSKKC